MADDQDDPIEMIVAVLELCQEVADALDNIQGQLFGFVKTQCRSLGEEVERARRLHAALTKQMLKDENYEGLTQYLQNESKILKTILERVKTSTPRRMQLHRRSQLRQFFADKAKQLRTEMQKLKDSLKDYTSTSVDNISNSLEHGEVGKSASSLLTEDESWQVIDTNDVLWNSEPGATASTDAAAFKEEDGDHSSQLDQVHEIPPPFAEISGLQHLHDVVTLNNEVFVLLDNFIHVYDMNGKEVQKCRRQNFKPISAVFLRITLCVIDKVSHSVMMFDRSLNYEKSFGGSHLFNPIGITVCESTDTVYVLNGRDVNCLPFVAKFSEEGRCVGRFSLDALEQPSMIKMDNLCQFIIYDDGKKFCHVFSPDFGKLAYGFGTRTPDESPLRCTGMDVDEVGNIYASLCEPGLFSSFECVVKYSDEGREISLQVEGSTSRGGIPFRRIGKRTSLPTSEEASKSQLRLRSVCGLHYYSCGEAEFLMIVDAGNNRIKIESL